MAASSHGKEIFRFMDLAPEIRNAIYDESLTTVETRLTCDLFLQAENVPATSLLLVSKQFKHEYEDRARYIKPKLTINDQWAFDFDINPTDIKLPLPSRKVAQVHINLITSGSHIVWLQDVMQRLPNITSLTVDMHDPGGPDELDSAESVIAAVLEPHYEELPNLVGFEVYYGPMRVCDPFPFSVDRMRKILTFSAKKRCFERVEGKEVEDVSAA